MTLDGNPVTPTTITPIDSGDTITYTPTALAGGSHSVVLSVSDAKGNTAATPTTWTFTIITQKTLHVQSISMQTITVSQNTYATATITIKDANNNPAKGATVTGQWSGATTDKDTATTNSLGTVTSQSNSIRGATGKTFTITVTNVVLTGYTFTPGTDTNSITK
jgi:hypothetical protein